MPLQGFESTISAGERPQTYALDSATIGIGAVHPELGTSLVTRVTAETKAR